MVRDHLSYIVAGVLGAPLYIDDIMNQLNTMKRYPTDLLPLPGG